MKRIVLVLAGLLILSAVPASAETRIVDGDTFVLDGERIRLINIDTPETWRFRCEDEQAVGQLAKERLGELLADGPLTIVREGTDYWHRTLAYVLAGEVDVGETLISEGLALPWQKGPKAKAWRLKQWCGQ